MGQVFSYTENAAGTSRIEYEKTQEERAVKKQETERRERGELRLACVAAGAVVLGYTVFVCAVKDRGFGAVWIAAAVMALCALAAALYRFVKE